MQFQVRMIRKEFIFEEDRPFRSCHASTLVRTKQGTLLAAWFGGTHEKHPDVAIWFSRRDTDRWSSPSKVADEAGLAHWNPVLFMAPNGWIYLYYKAGEDEQNWHTRVCLSKDSGISWTDPKVLVSGDIGGRGPVKNKPIILADGTWLAPASVEAENWDAFTDRSTDQGASWIASPLVPIDHTSFPREGVIQPTLWESRPGQVHMLLRSSCGKICRSDSTDGGKTWCAVYETDLPNNNSGIDVVKIDDQFLALIYNPVQQVGDDWGERTPLVISVSADNGRTWGSALVVEDEPGEFSYPCIIAEGRILDAAYTWNRERIVHITCQLTTLSCKEK